MQLGHDDALNVLFEKLGRDLGIGRTMLVGVACDACRDDQVDDRGHLLPMSLLVLRILLLHRRDELADELIYILVKLSRELRDKLHAVAASRLLIALLKIVLDVLLWLALVLFYILLSDRDVRDDQDLEEALKVSTNEVLVLWIDCALSDVAHNRKDESLALSSSRDLIARDLLPYLLKEQVCLGLKVLAKLELIELDQADNFGASLEDLLVVFCILHLR